MLRNRSIAIRRLFDMLRECDCSAVNMLDQRRTVS